MAPGGSRRAVPNLSDSKNKGKRLPPSSPPKGDAKRAKSDSQEATKEKVIPLTGLPPPTDYMSFINPDALALYEEVETSEHFRVASSVFWYAYSAWIRIVPPSEIAKIFDEAVWPKTMEKAKVKLEKPVLTQIFEQEYDAMSAIYVSKVLHYCDMYMELEAGKTLARDVQEKRARGHKIPSMSLEILTNGYKDHPGIRWGHEQVYDFFEPLQACSDTSPMGSDDDKHWFTADLDPVSKNYLPGGWYERLFHYAYTCVTQAIARKCDIRPSGGNRNFIELSRPAVKSLLSLVGVIGLDGKPLSAPFHFPLEVQPLEAWVISFRSDEVAPGAATEYTNKAGELLDRISDGSPLTTKRLHTIENIESSSTAQRAQLQEQAKEIIVIESKPEVNILEVRDLQNFIAPPKMYAPEISTQDYAFISGTTKTKVQIAIAIAEQARNDYARVIGSIDKEMKIWESEIATLEHHAKEIAFSESVGWEILERARNLAAKRDALQREADANYLGRASIESRLPSVINAAESYRPGRTPVASPMTISSPHLELAASIHGASCVLMSAPTNDQFSEVSSPPLQGDDLMRSIESDQRSSTCQSLTTNAVTPLLPSPMENHDRTKNDQDSGDGM